LKHMTKAGVGLGEQPWKKSLLVALSNTKSESAIVSERD
jgi:hypothetical protein